MKNIIEIWYPNTVEEEKQLTYKIGYNGVENINTISKNGEMASVNWLQIIANGKVIAEIKESVCDIYGSDDIEYEKTIGYE